MSPRLLLPLFVVTCASLPAQRWEPVPLVTAAMRAAGSTGGEGGQWPQAIESAPDGKLLLFGTDVGGIYRSTDGGLNWTPSNDGLSPRGAADFEFDPAFPNRVLMVAGNSLERPFHGLYLSRDGGVSWSNVQPYDNHGYRDFRSQVAFDRSSADPTAQRTRIAYWSSAPTKTRGKGFFKTTDGGDTWSDLPAAADIAGESLIKVHPTRGWIYAGNAAGLFRSRDGGATFEMVFAQPVTGLDVIAATPERVYLSTATSLRMSSDGGATFTIVNSDRFPPTKRSGVKRLLVSPADPKRMLLESDEDTWSRKRYVSDDGGVNWTKGQFDDANAFLPRNDREMVAAWSPVDPEIAWGIGGDFITRSTDGARNWRWSGAGYNAVMVGHSFTFNPTDPDLLVLPSQDYDAAITTDAGHTWRHSGVSGDSWGGYTYGAYAFGPDLIAAGSRTGWGSPSELRLRRGEKIERTGIMLDGESVGFGDPSDTKVAFLHNYRTADGGDTWAPMKNCRGVFTADPAESGRLYGTNGPAVVTSSDHGITWTEVVTLPEKAWVRDVAVDPVRRVLHIVSHGDALFRWASDAGLQDVSSRLPADQFGRRTAQSIATDPVDPSIVYTVAPGNTYNKDTAVARSTDGGATFVTLTRNPRLGLNLDSPDGGREAMWVRVHPKTRYAYTASNCFGVWRIAPPVSAAPSAH